MSVVTNIFNTTTTTEFYDGNYADQYTPTFLDFFLAIIIIGLFVALFCGSSCVLLVCFKRIMCSVRGNQDNSENSRGNSPSSFIVEAPPEYSNAALYPPYPNVFGNDDKEKPPSYESIQIENSITPITITNSDHITGNFPIQV